MAQDFTRLFKSGEGRLEKGRAFTQKVPAVLVSLGYGSGGVEILKNSFAVVLAASFLWASLAMVLDAMLHPPVAIWAISGVFVGAVMGIVALSMAMPEEEE